MENMKRTDSEFRPVDWSYSTNIYEVNLRQYTPEGTFNAFAAHLPRLRTMGVEVLWFMPIMPIGEQDRHGTLGSYYAIKDYQAANPEFGTVEDFKKLVTAAHQLGFRVIIDFVANHTANDNGWVITHPEYYCYNADGSIIHPHGWDDVSQLNFAETGVRDALKEAMKFWIEKCDIDGFRCDMAHLVPLDFWRDARREMGKIKNGLFWLAECEEPTYHAAFDATYTWRWMHASEDFYHGKINLSELVQVLYETGKSFPPEAFRLYFTSNHDENSWNGTEYEKYGDAAPLFAVFSCLWNGIPLIYTGQEMPNFRRLKFFDKDYIGWTGVYKLLDFYQTLLSLRKNHEALRAGDPAVSTFILSHDNDSSVFAFMRKSEKDSVIVILNASASGVHFQLDQVEGKYKNVFDGSVSTLTNGITLYLPEWGYLVYEPFTEG